MDAKLTAAVMEVTMAEIMVLAMPITHGCCDHHVNLSVNIANTSLSILTTVGC